MRVSQDIAVGVVMTHGDFPNCLDGPGKWAGFPINGIDEDTYGHLHFQQVKEAKAPFVMNRKVMNLPRFVTAGQYVLVATGSGQTLGDAQRAAYEVAGKIRWSSNVMYRTDIGNRVHEQLSTLQKFGYALDMHGELV